LTNLVECSSENRPYLLGVNHDTGDTVLYRPDCKLWTCPHCANVKTKQWASRVRRAITDHHASGDAIDAYHFLTVTIKETSGQLEKQIAIFRSAWDKLNKRMARSCPHELEYVCIPELSPVKKRLHAHVLITWDFAKVARIAPKRAKSGGNSQKWYSRWLHTNLSAVGLGYIYDLQELDSPELGAHYVTKYIGKGLNENFPSGFRRVRTSQHFPEVPGLDSDNNYEWTVLLCNSSGGRQLYARVLLGEVVFDLEKRQRVTTEHPLIKMVYPT